MAVSDWLVYVTFKDLAMVAGTELDAVVNYLRQLSGLGQKRSSRDPVGNGGFQTLNGHNLGKCEHSNPDVRFSGQSGRSGRPVGGSAISQQQTFINRSYLDENTLRRHVPIFAYNQSGTI